jgi:hypothetical protein
MREYVVFVRKFVQDNLRGVFNADDPRVKNLAQQAAAKLPHIVNTWGLPFSDGPGLVKLMLYDFVILCGKFPPFKISPLKAPSLTFFLLLSCHVKPPLPQANMVASW